MEPKLIYERYAGRMLTVCRRYCGCRDLARDMMQDGFIQVFKSLDKFTDRGEGSLRAWIERIMINTCLQYLRKRDVMKDTREISYREEDTCAEDLSVERVPEEVLLQFIEQMPPGYRTIFNLYVFEDKSHKEIGKLLGINENTSTSQYYRAKVWLTNKLKEYGKQQ